MHACSLFACLLLIPAATPYTLQAQELPQAAEGSQLPALYVPS